MNKYKTLGIATILFSACSFGQSALENLPETIDASQVFVFYSHGYIVEGDNPTPVHDRWGVYDFPAIKQHLSDPNYQLIATHRAANTPPFDYAQSLASQVSTLKAAGVPAHNIFLVGFSRGGFITAIASSYIKDTDVNYVILAACTSGLARNEDITIHGHLFSMYETSDTVGSCNDVVDRSPESITSYQEISISTGEEHGAFYRPIDEWVVPVKQWIHGQMANHG